MMLILHMHGLPLPTAATVQHYYCSAGADPEARDRLHRTTLHLAADFGDKPMLLLLLRGYSARYGGVQAAAVRMAGSSDACPSLQGGLQVHVCNRDVTVACVTVACVTAVSYNCHCCTTRVMVLFYCSRAVDGHNGTA